MPLKIFYPLLFLLLFINTSAQSFKDAVRDSTCECETRLRSSGARVDYSDLQECIKQSMRKNNTLMVLEIKTRFGDSANFEKGRQYGATLAHWLDTALVYSCDAYFRITDSLRYAVFAEYNADSIGKALALAKDTATLLYRAERARYEFVTGSYNQALVDFDRLLPEMKTNATVRILKALCLDRLKRYEEAASLFYLLAEKSKQPSYLVHAAIENQKLKLSR